MTPVAAQPMKAAAPLLIGVAAKSTEAFFTGCLFHFNFYYMNIISLSNKQREKALFLLASASLPSTDIDEKVELFALKTGNAFVGTIGCEINGTMALLRSLSVHKDHRNKG